MCADGQPHRCYITKEDASSLTISIEAFSTSIIIDARKVRDVISFDVPGSYLNANNTDDKFILLNIEGGFVDIMRGVNLEHKKMYVYIMD